MFQRYGREHWQEHKHQKTHQSHNSVLWLCVRVFEGWEPVSSCRWKYSFNSIMEVHIKRISRMWSWSNIRQHRENLKAYKKAYKTKLAGNKQNQENDLQIQVKHKHTRRFPVKSCCFLSQLFGCISFFSFLFFSFCRTVTLHSCIVHHFRLWKPSHTTDFWDIDFWDWSLGPCF